MYRAVAAFGLVVVVVLLLQACGGGSGGVGGVSVSPSVVTLAPRESQVFTAVVAGGGGVVWEASGGSVVGEGLTVTFVAPRAAGVYSLSAIDSDDASKRAVAVVTVEAGSSSEGVLLDESRGALAVGEVFDLLPTAALGDEITVEGLIVTRLDAIIDPEASSAAVNAALSGVGARISSMSADDISVTLIIPAVSGVDEARAVGDELVSSGAFLFVSPGVTVVPEPVVGGAGVTSQRLPGGAADSNIAHLKAIRAPAAWNVSGAIPAGRSVTVLVPDNYESPRIFRRLVCLSQAAA